MQNLLFNLFSNILLFGGDPSAVRLEREEEEHMEELEAARYWCHMCSRIVSPIVELELEIKCPDCQSGFIEEMSGTGQDQDADLGSDRAFSLWAPILLGMMGNRPTRRRRSRRGAVDENDVDDHHHNDDDNEEPLGGETELDRELESIIRRRRRGSATVLQLLRGIQAGMISESENSETNGERDRERERVVLINPFSQTIVVQGSYDPDQNPSSVGSLGDYFIGPGLDLLLQHLAENDPNRYGTPPAQKEAIEALPSVKIEKPLQCSVCLDDFEVGHEAKEMPCKHKFHSGCILPWLELHSSCPVCRFQIAADESKLDSDGSSRRENHSAGGSSGEEGDNNGRNGSGRRFSVPWPFNGLFSSSSGSQHGSGGGGNTSSSSSTNASAGSTHGDEH